MNTMHTTDEDWPAAVLSVLEQQHELVDQLERLADQQAVLIEQAKTDALLGLLTQRQGIIDRFSGTQDDLSRLTEHLDRRLSGVDEERRERIQRLIGEIGDRLACVMQRDEQDQQALEAARNGHRRELLSLDAARQARRAYRGVGAVNNRFADQRG